jgi:hypothetical protein
VVSFSTTHTRFLKTVTKAKLPGFPVKPASWSAAEGPIAPLADET